MRKRFACLMILVLISGVFPGYCMARSGYVSDMLLLTFREGPGNEYKVIKALKSNTPINVLEEQNGFYKVELTTGEIGWVDKKYITFELPNAVIARQLDQKNKQLESQLENLRSGKEDLGTQFDSMKTEYEKQIEDLKILLTKSQNKNTALSNELEKSTSKYETLINQTENIQNIVQDNKAFQEKNETLSKELEALKSKHKNAFRTAMIKWFLAGVGVLLIGWIIGSSVSSKKRGSGYLLD